MRTYEEYALIKRAAIWFALFAALCFVVAAFHLPERMGCVIKSPSQGRSPMFCKNGPWSPPFWRSVSSCATSIFFVANLKASSRRHDRGSPG